MIPLDSKRWLELTTWINDSADLPRILRNWREAIGTPNECDTYERQLHDTFLHQATIVNAAFAIVPYLIDACTTESSLCRVEYLADTALVEARRLNNGVKYNKGSGNPYPEWLMTDYHAAIKMACNLADDAIDAAEDEERKRQLVALKPALHGNAKLAFQQW